SRAARAPRLHGPAGRNRPAGFQWSVVGRRSSGDHADDGSYLTTDDRGLTTRATCGYAESHSRIKLLAQTKAKSGRREPYFVHAALVSSRAVRIPDPFERRRCAGRCAELRPRLRPQLRHVDRGFREALRAGAFEPLPRRLGIGDVAEPAGQVAAEHELRVGVATFGGTTEIVLRLGPIGLDVMPPAVQRADGENGADMVLRRRLLEPAERRRVVARAATAVHQHLSERDLCIHHAGLGGAADPGARLHRIALEPAPLGEHAAIPVLRIDDALGGAAQPERRLAFIALDADPLGKADAEIERRHQIAGA